jgi:hypothetical protein
MRQVRIPMAQPKTKARIIQELNTERKRLESILMTLTPDQLIQKGVIGEWSIKDILAHLADWEEHLPVLAGGGEKCRLDYPNFLKA